MKLSTLGEFGLIEKIRKISALKSSRAAVGIGDDAAALKLSPHSTLLATTDMLIEGVHFDLSYTDFHSLGWKSAAVNISDVAAMGGVPRFALTSLAIPPDASVEGIAEFYRGFKALSKKYDVELVGGDTCSSRKGFIVSVTVLGEVEKSMTVTRSGARTGDRIFVTGTLGDSAAGLELLKKRAQGAKSSIRNAKSAIAKLVKKHLKPVPRVEWGRKLALSGIASAMIDVSDGLSSDLGHICDQSGVGAEIHGDSIPLSNAIRSARDFLRRPLIDYALSGGEDYELLFTAPPDKLKKLLSLGIKVSEIGRITQVRHMHLANRTGGKTLLKMSGFDHFSGSGGARRRRILS